MQTEIIHSPHAELSINDGVAELSHRRPEKRNALSAEMRRAYCDMLARVESDPTIRALIITGSGGSFCAGGDLKGVKDRMSKPAGAHSPAMTMRNNLLGAHSWIGRLRNLEIPVIAAVDGAAVGAGMSLALAADFVLASRRAWFSMVFPKIGLIPDMGALYVMPRLVGMAVAKELLLTGRRVSAEEGQQLGLVHSLFEADALAEEARRFASRFKNAPRSALGTTKRLLNMSFETPYATLAELEANAQAVETCSPYHGEALDRFVRGEPALYDWDRDA
ncbi:MAG: enoyl-CoA hydratase/isomerase family protein [Cupriavidus necator]